MKILFHFTIFILSFSTFANPPKAINFAKPFEYYDAVISPGGDYIAVERSADEGKALVAIVSSKDLTLLSHVPARSDVSPFNPVWINGERLVMQFFEDFKSYEHHFANGELLAINANGKKERQIIEHQRYINNDTLNTLHGFANVIHHLPDEKKHILISFRDYKFTRTGIRPKVYKLNTFSGKIKLIAEAPSYNAYFTLSPNGELQYSVGLDKNDIKKANNFVVHKFDNGKWIPLDSIKIDSDGFEIVAATSVPEEVYVRTEYANNPDKIYRYNLNSGDRKLIFKHANVDPASLDIDSKTGELIAVHFEDGYPNIHIVDQNHLYARWYPALFQAFDGNRVRITSATDDGSKLIVHVSGAAEPGQFHIFDTQKKKLRYLFNAASWIDSEVLSEVQPISFESRDKKKIHGYLTLPKNVDGKSPLVVLPHGGPHGPRDWWSFDSEVQFLASRGYAVLQVNFRGSGGYGYGFEEAGKRKWGSEIQYDIIDGTKWAAALDSIDENRICIMGGSFGGYSALMSPTIEPNLYKCAIGFVGVYDLNLMWTTADIEKWRIGENFLMEAIGKDKEELNRFSPLYNIDKLKVPVFLAHGKMDWRVDVKHYEKMKKALEDKDHPHETMLLKKEGHGFANEKNRERYLIRVEKFLEKHIGDKD